MAGDFDMRFDEVLASALRRALAELPQRVNRKVIGQASKKAMRPIVKTARAKVPRRTGLLRKSLGVVQKKYSASGNIYTIVGPRTGFKTRIGTTRTGAPIYADPVNYSHLVEFGTHDAVVRPRPFIRPAFDAHKRAALSVMGREFAAGVNREAAKFEMRVS